MRKEKYIMAININEISNFTLKQKEATELADNNKYTCFWGDRAVGRSYWLRHYSLRFLLMIAEVGIKNVSVALICKDYYELMNCHVPAIQDEFPEYIGVLAEKKKSGGLGFFLHPQYGGGIIRLMPYERKYFEGRELALLAVDNINKFTIEEWNIMESQLRWPGIKDTKFLVTSPFPIRSYENVMARWEEAKVI
jgi:hypothetical protein